MSFRKYQLGSYEEMRRGHSWEVPERYNIAQDVCDKHAARQARDGLGGLPRHRAARRASASCRTSPTSSPTCWRPRRRARGPRRHAAALAAGDRRRVHRHLQARRDPAVDVGALRRRRHRAPAPRLRRQGAGDRHRQPPPHPRRDRRGRARDRATAWREGDIDLDGGDAGASTATRWPTPPPRTRPSSTTPRAPPARPRASCTPTATCSRHEEFEFCHDVQRRRALPRHGRVGLGRGHLPAAGAVALRRRGARFARKGGSTPRSSCASSPSTGSRTCSPRPRRCGR